MASAIYLLVDPKKGQVFPVSPRAFSRINAPVSKTLTRNADAVFLTPAGELVKINSITLSRDLPTTWLGLWLAFPANVVVQWAKLDMSFQTFRDTLLAAIKRHRQQFGEDDELWWIINRPIDDVTDRIMATQDFTALYAIVGFPADQDCLDLL